LLGLIGTAQIRRIPKSKWTQTRTEKAMVPIASVPTVSGEADLWSALEVLERSGLDAMLVAGLKAGSDAASDASPDAAPDASPEPGIVLVSRRSSAKVVHDRAEAKQREMAAAGLIRKGRFGGR
jgi:hypothetical protein